MAVEWLGQPQCPDGFYWSPVNESCTRVCPAGQFWNNDTKQCQGTNPCAAPFQYDDATQRCVLPVFFPPPQQPPRVPPGEPRPAPPGTSPPPLETVTARKRGAGPLVLLGVGLAAVAAIVAVSR